MRSRSLTGLIWSIPGIRAAVVPFILLLPAGLLFSGCLEIGEDLRIHPDRSGSYMLRLDAGPAVGLLMLSGMEGRGEVKAAKEALRAMVQGLHRVDGLSRIMVDTSLTDGKLSIGFDFSGPRALNEAFYAMGDIEKRFYHPSLYRVRGHGVKRRDIAPFLRMYVRKNYPELQDNELTRQVRLATTCTLPGTFVRGDGNGMRYTDQDVSFAWPLYEVLNGRMGLGYKVRYAREGGH